MRNRAPFRPFQLHLTNGETLPVRHPEHLAIPPEPGTDLFVVWVGSDWNLVDAGQIARVSLFRSETKEADRSKRSKFRAPNRELLQCIHKWSAL